MTLCPAVNIDAEQRAPIWSNDNLETRWIIDMGDTHVGDRLGLYPGAGFVIDGGSLVQPNPIQRAIREFYDEVIDMCLTEIGGEDFILLHKGDVVEGHHHRSKSALSANHHDQVYNSTELFKPLCDRASRTYFVRGTPAHVGEDSEIEEIVAGMCQAEKSAMGHRCHPLLVFKWNGLVFHVAHHIAGTSVAASRATALMSELVELQRTAGAEGLEAPDIVSRGHRHVGTMVSDCTHKGMAWSVATPGWQGKTGFAYKIKGGRVGELRVGLILWEYSKKWGAIPHMLHRRIARQLPLV